MVSNVLDGSINSAPNNLLSSLALIMLPVKSSVPSIVECPFLKPY